MNTYTPQGGLSPQNTQLVAGQPNGANSAPPPGSPASAFPSDQALNSQFAAANANNVNLALPSTRQGFITNSNIPGMQANYDDLARKLFEYDTGVLNPQFQGQNPGTPGDAAAFGRVDASPLGMTVGSAGLPASQGIYNANPKYAYQAQTSQANSVLDLLDTLNRGIGDTFSNTKGVHAAKTDAAQKALDTIVKLMSLKQDAIDKAEARKNSGGLAGENQAASEARLFADAKKGVTFTDLVLRYTADGLSPSRIRELYNQANYYKKPATESESDVMKLIQEGKKPTKQTQKDRDAVKSMQTSLDTIKRARAALDNTGTSILNIGWEQRQKLPGHLGGISKKVADTANVLGTLNEDLFKVAGTAFTGSERKLLEAKVFDLTKDTDVNRSNLDEREKLIKAKLKSYGVAVDAGEQTITIKNKKTGQTMTIKASEKGKYGL